MNRVYEAEPVVSASTAVMLHKRFSFVNYHAFKIFSIDGKALETKKICYFSTLDRKVMLEKHPTVVTVENFAAYHPYSRQYFPLIAILKG